MGVWWAGCLRAWTPLAAGSCMAGGRTGRRSWRVEEEGPLPLPPFLPHLPAPASPLLCTATSCTHYLWQADRRFLHMATSMCTYYCLLQNIRTCLQAATSAGLSLLPPATLPAIVLLLPAALAPAAAAPACHLSPHRLTRLLPISCGVASVLRLPPGSTSSAPAQARCLHCLAISDMLSQRTQVNRNDKRGARLAVAPCQLAERRNQP